MTLVSHETLEHLYKRMEMMNLAGGNVAVKGKGPLLFGRQFVGRGIAGGAVFNFSDNWLWLGLLGEDKRGGGIQTAAKGMEKEEDEGVRGECEGVIYP